MTDRKKKVKDFFARNRFFTIFLFGWILVFCSLRTVQHFSFGTNAFDLSIADYTMFYTLNGALMHEPFHGYWGNHSAHHFTPILFFITSLYFFLNGPLFLFYIQVLARALSSLILHIPERKQIYMELNTDSAQYILVQPRITFSPSIERSSQIP